MLVPLLVWPTIFFFSVLEGTSLPELTRVDVEVLNPADATSPFDQRRQLRIPVGYAIEVYARVSDARFLLTLPNGDLLVSRPETGKVSLVRMGTSDSKTRVSDFLTGATSPHDMVMHKVGSTNYIYISEAHQVARYTYKTGDTKAGKREIIVKDLPNQKDFRHPLKNIAIGNNTLYVAIGSSSNDDTKDLTYDPKHGAIYGYPIGGGNKRLISEGVRNAEGLAFPPGSNDLWVVVNQRDNVQYPYRDNSGNYGKVIEAYVDDNPPEEFSLIIENKHYGWPYCNPVGSTSMKDLEYVADAHRNPDGKIKHCKNFMKVAKGIEPHSAPLGLTFWTGSKAPSEFKNGAVVGLHGSWNRKRDFSGHKVVYYPWVKGRPGEPYELVSGWVTDAEKKQRWGRPVDTAVMNDGSLAISDDDSGTVYRLRKM